MSPFQIRIMLHYLYSPDDFKNEAGRIDAGSIPEKPFIIELADMQLLEVNPTQEPKWHLTDKGRAYVEFLCAMPIPVMTWGMPK